MTDPSLHFKLKYLEKVGKVGFLIPHDMSIFLKFYTYPYLGGARGPWALTLREGGASPTTPRARLPEVGSQREAPGKPHPPLLGLRGQTYMYTAGERYGV